MDLVLAVRARRQLHRVDVVVVVRVALHREDGLRRVERHVGAVEVGLRERRRSGSSRVPSERGGREQVEAAARLVALVVEHLAVAARDVDRVGAVGVLHGGLPLDEQQRLHAGAAAARRGLRGAAGPHRRR